MYNSALLKRCVELKRQQSIFCACIFMKMDVSALVCMQNVNPNCVILFEKEPTLSKPKQPPGGCRCLWLGPNICGTELFAFRLLINGLIGSVCTQAPVTPHWTFSKRGLINSKLMGCGSRLAYVLISSV